MLLTICKCVTITR